MTQNERSQRKLMFFQVMDAADDDFVLWAAHQFYNDAKLRFLEMPWDTKHPAHDYTNSKTKQKASEKLHISIEQALKGIQPPHAWEKAGDVTGKITKNSISPSGVFKKTTKTGVVKETTFNWTHVLASPVVNKKSYHPIGQHLKNGMFIKHKLTAYDLDPNHVSTVVGRTKYYVKIKAYENSHLVKQIPYSYIYYVGDTELTVLHG